MNSLELCYYISIFEFTLRCGLSANEANVIEASDESKAVEDVTYLKADTMFKSKVLHVESQLPA